MVRIPTARELGQVRVAGAGRAAQINPNVAKELGRAGAALNRAFSSIGASIGGVLQEQSDLKDTQLAADIDTETSETFTNLGIRALDNPGPSGEGFQSSLDEGSTFAASQLARTADIADPKARLRVQKNIQDRSRRFGVGMANRLRESILSNARGAQVSRINKSLLSLQASPHDFEAIVKSQLQDIESGRGRLQDAERTQKLGTDFIDDAFGIVTNQLALGDPKKLLELLGKVRAFQRSIKPIEGAVPAKGAALSLDALKNVKGISLKKANQSNIVSVMQTAKEKGFDPVLAAAIGHFESDGTFSTTASNSRSSAKGIFQFLKSNRKEFGFGQTAAEQTASFIRKNNIEVSGVEKRLGRPLAPWERYLVHFQGPGGATSLLRANSTKPVASVVGAAVVKANPFMRGQSVGQFLGRVKREIDTRIIAFSKAASPNQIANVEDAALGDIDLSKKRIRDAAGIEHSESTITVAVDDLAAQAINKSDKVLRPLTGKPVRGTGKDQKFVVIPTVVDGEQLSEKEAEVRFRRGDLDPVIPRAFATAQEADRAARARSTEIGRRIAAAKDADLVPRAAGGKEPTVDVKNLKGITVDSKIGKFFFPRDIIERLSVQKLTGQVRGQFGGIKKQIQKTIADLTVQADNGQQINRKDIRDLRASADLFPNDLTIQNNISDLAARSFVQTQFRALSGAEREDAKAAMEAISRFRNTPQNQRILKAATKELAIFKAAMRTDPLGFASREGSLSGPLSPLILNEGQSALRASLGRRKQQANQVAAMFGIKPKFFQPNEAIETAKRIENSDIESKLEFSRALVIEMGLTDATRALGQLSGVSPIFAHLAGLSMGTDIEGRNDPLVRSAELGFKGQKFIKESGEKKGDLPVTRSEIATALRENWGSVFQGRQPEMLKNIIGAAHAMAVGLATEPGRSGVSKEDLIKEVLQRTFSASVRENGGDPISGGLFKFRDQTIIVPTEMTTETFEDVIDFFSSNIDVPSLENINLFDKFLRSGVNGTEPIHARTEKPLTMRDLSEVRLVTAGDGKYILQLDGEEFISSTMEFGDELAEQTDGTRIQPWIFDIRQAARLSVVPDLLKEEAILPLGTDPVEMNKRLERALQSDKFIR